MMHAVRRRLFTLAAGVSAVLCVANAVLWARSYGGVGWVRWASRPGDDAADVWSASSRRGILLFASWRVDRREPIGLTGLMGLPPAGLATACAGAGGVRISLPGRPLGGQPHRIGR
jgi:hypothetical protein